MTPLYRLLRELRLRDQMFPADIAHGPGFNMLLDLAQSAQTGRAVCVSSLCFASLAPETTALRHIGILVELGWVERHAVMVDPKADRLGMAASGGSFGTYLSRLSGPGLIERDRERGVRLSMEVMGR